MIVQIFAGWHTRLMKPLVPFHSRNFGIRLEVLFKIRFKLTGVHSRQSKVLDVILHKGFKLSRSAHKFLQKVQEVKSLFVGNLGECVIRVVIALEPWNQRSKSVTRSNPTHFFTKFLIACNCMELKNLLTVNLTKDLAFQEYSPTFIEPEMIPPLVGHQVACPAMSYLVRNHMCQTTIPCNQRRRYKGKAWIFHSTIGEGRRKHQQVIPAPTVRSSQRLSSFQELIRVSKLCCGCIHHVWFCPHPCTWTNFAGFEFTHGKSKQISWDGYLLYKIIPQFPLFCFALSFLSRERYFTGRHQDSPGGRYCHGSFEGKLDCRCVLAGEQAAGMDSLALSKR
mmetsp:Transcript_10400/g.63460  ORF Transcript_10400/g.63460 Transcript_10400/m.63460 type:complete len:337 (-) Transcript_10400:480-1490(-)